jgi:hypothetical protein
MNDSSTPDDDNLEALHAKIAAFEQEAAKAKSGVAIKLDPRDYVKNLDEFEQALITARALVYQRDRALVTVGYIKAISSDNKERWYFGIVKLNAIALREIAANVCTFSKHDARRNRQVRILPPEYLLQGLVNRPTFKLPVLKAIVNHPYITKTGEIVDKPGYNPGTGVYYDPLGVEFPAMPEITKSNARDVACKSLERIKTLLHTFEFVDDASRTVALSQLLTGISRHALTGAPVHVGDAALRGSGKTMITDICAIIAIGKPAPALNMGSTAEEFEKRLGGMLMAGHVIILLDNCSATIEGDLLNSASTAETVMLRPLGGSQMTEITAGALICPNGNNIVVGGDATRRSLKYRLDPGVERPELLQFNYNPLQDARNNRPELVIAALSLLKTHHVAEVKPPPVFQSFQDWSNTVRSALIWLGEADPCDTTEALQADDPQKAQLRTVYQQWWSHVGNELTTIAEVIKRAVQKKPAMGADGKPIKDENDQVVTQFISPGFRQALLDVAGDGPMINSQKLGKWLRAHLDRRITIDDNIVCMTRDKTLSREGVAQWRMVGEKTNTSMDKAGSDNGDVNEDDDDIQPF